MPKPQPTDAESDRAFLQMLGALAFMVLATITVYALLCFVSPPPNTVPVKEHLYGPPR